MITIETIDTTSKSAVSSFVDLPYRLYKDHPQWVPPLLIDAKSYLNRNKHPFYEHSEVEFFIARREKEIVGRLAVLNNRRFNEYHKKNIAQFYFYEVEDDLEISEKLFNSAIKWARGKNLNQLVGPKGMGPLDGYGILVDGYEHRQMMTMLNYNYPYYPIHLEKLGFHKEVDFVSCYLNISSFHIPARIHSIGEKVQKRGTLSVHRFNSKSELKKWVSKIGQAYNNAFINNWEYYPLTDNEIKYVVDTILTVADPRLIKIITHNTEVVGFLFAFPDVSSALQRAKGRLFPFGLVDLLIEMKKTKWVAINGIGILPQFQGRGGNALLYSEMEKTIREFHYTHADLTQVAETAVQMRNDLENIGGKAYKNHRVFIKDI